MNQKKSILSCIQPTGDAHLGNYLGAIKNWVDLQKDYTCYYGVVDNHAMTAPYKPNELRARSWESIFQLLACGVRAENLFIQSLIPEHLELCWILGCVTSYGDMTRMTQFKDKSTQIKSSNKDAHVSAGLFYYPILQAADILIYHPSYVPVGQDQEQHLELTRAIVDRFNYIFKTDYFTSPESLFTATPKILSFADPTKKMGKSLGPKHYLNLFSKEEEVVKQVRSAVTDTGESKEGEMSPGVDNLFTILSALGGEEAHAALLDDYRNKTLKYSELKHAVTEVLLVLTKEKREKLEEIHAEKRKYKELIRSSSHQIRQIAQKTLAEVKEITGLLTLRNE